MHWDYVMRVKIGNKDGRSKDFLTRKHGGHHGENQKVLMCPYLQHIWLVIGILMNIPG